MASMAPQYLLGRPSAGVTTGTGPWFPVLNAWTLLTIATTGIGTITAGTLLIEETDDPSDPNAAMPSQLSTLDLTTISAGKKNVAHVGPGAYEYIRARLSANITGGGQAYVTLAGAG